MLGRTRRIQCTLSWEEGYPLFGAALDMKGRLGRARGRTTDCFSFSLKQCRHVKRSSLNSDLRRAGAALVSGLHV
jgi:hypothetical protein